MTVNLFCNFVLFGFAVILSISTFKLTRMTRGLIEKIEKDDSRIVNSLSSWNDRINSLVAQINKIVDQSSARFVQLDERIESLESPSTKNKIKKKLGKHYKRK